MAVEAEEASPQVRFEDANLSPHAKLAIKEGFGYEFMSEVQAASLNSSLEGKNVVVRSKTGSGKTLSFLIPTLERLRLGERGRTNLAGIDALVLSPVRELSQQIAQETEKMVKHYPGIQSICMIGGTSWEEDLAALDAAGSDMKVLIATPGRIETHIQKSDGFAERLAHTQIVVLDEVDQLVHVSFLKATQGIITSLGESASRQFLFYSATMSDEVTSLVKQAVADNYSYLDIISDDELIVPERIKQMYSIVPTQDMTLALWKAIHLAKASSPEPPKIVVVSMTGRIAAYYADAFRAAGSDLEVFEIHARLNQNKRTAASDAFRAAPHGVLFTSDVSSRGLDYPGVTDVIQLGVPKSKAEYIHRVGRTGRAGDDGRGHLLVHEFEKSWLSQLADLPLQEVALDSEAASIPQIPDFAAMDIVKNTKAQAYYSRINHVMRYFGEVGTLEIMREAHRFATSIGAVDAEGRPPEITEDNADKMGVKGIDDPSVYVVPNPPPPQKQEKKGRQPKA